MTPDMLERFAKNPQFYVKPSDDCEMMFAITQTGGRLPHEKKYYKYPFKELLNFGMVAVFKVPSDKEHLQAFDKSNIVFKSQVRRERENAGRLKLKGG